MSSPTQELPIIERCPPRHVYRPSVMRHERMVALAEGICLPAAVIFSTLLFAHCIASFFGWKP
ncbi:hypothetical protein R8Z50_30795 [Longispora sp. K20-0274]|uniref:hypothetical protein n=1 Tax=Longispora sp. K20-0274 TaxID=3088255 RepID=UPI00399AE44D